MKILSQREPIADVLKKDNITPEQRKKLELALKVREFSQKQLFLKASNNYTSFVDLKRPYVSYIVTASPKWELTSYLYWFPIVGKLPYKGYFAETEAQEAEREFDQNQYDTMVRGVTAYSTLGWFDDPILSTMLGGDDYNLVNLIIHESTHATLYIKSQADFNEQLATFIGNIGTEYYYNTLEGKSSKTLKQISLQTHDDKLFSKFITQEIIELEKWYKSQTQKVEVLRLERLSQIQKKFIQDIQPKMKTSSYHYFANAKINNATLLHYKTYVYDLDLFAKAFAKNGSDFQKFITFCKKLEKASDPLAELKKYVSSPES